MTEIILAALAVWTPVLCVWAYRQGLRDAQRMARGEEPRPLAEKPRPKAKEDPEQDKARALLARVESYNVEDAMK